MPRDSLVKLDQHLMDRSAAQAADGFEYGFSTRQLGLAYCVHCDSSRGLLKFRFSEGELRCLVVCQECGATGAGYSVSGEAHPHGQYVLAHDWRGVFDVGFQRWQLANAEKPVVFTSRQVDFAVGAVGAGFGRLRDFLASRRSRVT